MSLKLSRQKREGDHSTGRREDSSGGLNGEWEGWKGNKNDLVDIPVATQHSGEEILPRNIVAAAPPQSSEVCLFVCNHFAFTPKGCPAKLP